MGKRTPLIVRSFVLPQKGSPESEAVPLNSLSKEEFLSRKRRAEERASHIMSDYYSAQASLGNMP